MPVTQCRLKSDTLEQTTWLPSHPKLRAGMHVTLKDSEDPTRVWLVVETYSTESKNIVSPDDSYATI